MDNPNVDCRGKPHLELNDIMSTSSDVALNPCRLQILIITAHLATSSDKIDGIFLKNYARSV